MDGQSGPIARPAFAKATQAKINKISISSFITLLSVTTMRFHMDVVIHCRYCCAVYLFPPPFLVRLNPIFPLFLVDMEP